MSKLRVQGGKLCVVAGQLEQCCQPTGTNCDAFGLDGPDCALVSLFGISLNPDPVFTFLTNNGFVTCSHVGQLTTIFGQNGTALVQRSPTPSVTGWNGVKSGFMATGVSIEDWCQVGPTPNSVAYSTTASIYYEIMFACAPSDNTLRVVGVTVFLIDSNANYPFIGGVNYGFEGAAIFTWSPNDGNPDSGARLGEPVPNLIETDVLTPLVLGGFAVVTIPDECVPPPPVYAIAQQCDTGDQIVVDPATNADAKPGIRRNDLIYRLTSEEDPGPPVTVEWVDETCDTNADRFRLATRCPNGRRPGNYPETIRCPIETPVGTSLFILASGGGGLTCVIRYVATDQTTDDESLQIGTPTTRTACSGLDYCIDPDGGTGDQPSDLSELCFICTGPAQPPVCSVPAVQAYLQSNCGRRLPGSLTQTSTPRAKPCLPCQQRRDAGLEAALAAQRAASGCRGCGDAGGETLI